MKKLLLALVAVAMTANVFAGRYGSCATCPKKSCAPVCEAKAEDCPACEVKCPQRRCVDSKRVHCEPACFKTVVKRVKIPANKHTEVTYSCPTDCSEVQQGREAPVETKSHRMGRVEQAD